MTFEHSKNTKAIAVTAFIHIVLLLIFLLIRFHILAPLLSFSQLDVMDLDVVPVSSLNLGTSDQGMGVDQPELPGQPAPERERAHTPGIFDNKPVESGHVSNTKATRTETEATHNAARVPEKKVAEAPAKQIETQEHIKNVPAVRRSTAKPSLPVNSNRFNTNATAANSRSKPAQARPSVAAGNSGGENAENVRRHVLTGLNGTGTGGNGSHNYHPSSGQGNGSGYGDKGKLGGSPTGISYTGLPGRFLVAQPSKTAAFNEGGTVRVRIRVDRQGQILSYSILSSSNNTIRNITIQKLASMRYNSQPQALPVQTGDIVFSFKTR